jgi:hypothetical protein
MKKLLRFGCLIILIGVGACSLLYAVSPHPPRTPTPVQVGSAPTDSAPVSTSIPTKTGMPSTLDEAGRAILATQAWFTKQQTQAAGGQSVDFVPTDTPLPTDKPEQVIYPTQLPAAQAAPAQPTIQPITAQGDTAQVLGSFTFPAGLYRARVTTPGFFIADLQITSGECGTGSYLLSPNLFNLGRGQGNGAEAVLRSNGCTAFIELSNITDAWRLEISQIG